MKELSRLFETGLDGGAILSVSTVITAIIKQVSPGSYKDS